MGCEAVLALMNAKPENQPVVIGINGNQTIHVPLMEAVEKTKLVAKAMADKDFEHAVELRGSSFQRNLETCLQLSKIRPKVKSEVRTFFYSLFCGFLRLNVFFSSLNLRSHQYVYIYMCMCVRLDILMI